MDFNASIESQRFNNTSFVSELQQPIPQHWYLAVVYLGSANESDPMDYLFPFLPFVFFEPRVIIIKAVFSCHYKQPYFEMQRVLKLNILQHIFEKCLNLIISHFYFAFHFLSGNWPREKFMRNNFAFRLSHVFYLSGNSPLVVWRLWWKHYMKLLVTKRSFFF